MSVATVSSEGLRSASRLFNKKIQIHGFSTLGLRHLTTFGMTLQLVIALFASFALCFYKLKLHQNY